METSPTPRTFRERFATCRACLAVALAVCLGGVVWGVTLPWLVPPDLTVAVARLRASPGAASPELLLAVERNPWVASDGRGPLVFGDVALWLAAAGAAVGLLAAVRARGLPAHPAVRGTALVLWVAAAACVGVTVVLHRSAYLDATQPWGAAAGTVAYRVERQADPPPNPRISERVRLGPLHWGCGLFVALAGTLGGAGALALARPPGGRPGKETATGEP